MDAIDTVKARLAKYSGIRYSETPDRIDIHPADESGFTVSLLASPSGYTVHFDGWHEEFSSEADALDCLAFGLSAGCRLAVIFRGATATRWIVESLQDGKWTQDSVTGVLLSPFWRPARVVYRQNTLIAAG